jgi:tetratricopeptide (TPR) repeat protein
MMMQVLRKFDQFLRRCRPYTSFALALFAGMLLILASLCPWLFEPLGDSLSAWEIPVYIGWPLRLPALNYGLLCTVGAILASVAGGASAPLLSTKLSVAIHLFVKRRLKGFYHLIAIYCLIISLLFCLQYLFLDIRSIDQLVQNKRQSLLIAYQLGYHSSRQFIPIEPFQLDSNLFISHLSLLLDQWSFGILMPVLAAVVLLRSSRQVVVMEPPAYTSSRRRWIGVSLFILIALCLLGRVPIALFCESIAGTALQGGDYAKASRWLDRAVAFDPSLNEVAFYHVQRGQIDYFVFHDTQGQDSLAYTASVAYQGRKYQEAYLDLFQTWQLHPTTPWITAELEKVIMRSIEVRKPLQSRITSSGMQPPVNADNRSLSYVQELLRVDPSNVYGHYILGRIDCDLRLYLECTHEMQKVIALSSNKEIQSSAYIYIGLSEAGQGNYITSRIFLMKAVQLDPGYYNNTAREELSGLH